MNRPAVIFNKHKADGFFAGVNAKDVTLTQSAPHTFSRYTSGRETKPPLTPQHGTQARVQGRTSLSQNFNLFLERARWSGSKRKEADTSGYNCNVVLRDRSGRTTRWFRPMEICTSGGTDNMGHQEIPGKIPSVAKYTTNKCRRILGVVFPAYGSPRNVAAQEDVGRKRRDRDGCKDKDVSDTESDSTNSGENSTSSTSTPPEGYSHDGYDTHYQAASSEASLHQANGLICCCLWPSLSRHQHRKFHPDRGHQTESAPKHTQVLAPSSGGTQPSLGRTQARSISDSGQVHTTPTQLKIESASVPSGRTYPPSAQDWRVDQTSESHQVLRLGVRSVGVQTTEMARVILMASRLIKTSGVTSFIPSLIVGPIEAGALGNGFLTGAFCVQAYIYFTRFSADKRSFKAMALILLLLQLAHFASGCFLSWNMTVSAVEDPLSLLWDVTVPISVVTLLTMLLAFVVQLSEKAWIPAIIGMFLICLRQIPAYVLFDTSTVEDVLAYRDRQTLLVLAFTSALISDAWMTFIVVYYLWRKQKDMNSERERLVHLLDFSARSSYNIWLSIYILFGSVYANVMMSTMNGRWILRHHSEVIIYQNNRNVSRQKMGYNQRRGSQGIAANIPVENAPESA
ncbi:hypothetical protein CONPUDRAFT_147589 [Coniophora puteana RWD-64-598 SS2]|uniref:Uncharacterized protein n=1 Tax=Coniophora puteana (strain RWD-64-598) TaxID=741705 RepID=R7SED5_CONPW|nr:uncharacterized protein CONPUDRAFT_147589 [Coniophora puteana RWD-64-598 SS2]EIW74543.1 hypothetical protein CONPUDRAFT_147589 [Coniophora puteana RWD-64-598 SS2]